MIIMNKRKLFTGLASLIAAPAIVRVTSLMPIKPIISEGMQVYTTVDAEYWYTKELLEEINREIVRTIGRRT